MRALSTRSLLPAGPALAPAGGPVARLQLTSLVDMMVILVVFLLQSFSVEGQLVTPAADLELAPSRSRNPLAEGLVVEVGLHRIVVAGREVGPTADLTGDGPDAPANLDRARAAAPTVRSEGPVLVQADRRLEYRQLSRVLAACARAGWRDVSLVVLEDES